MNAPAGSTVNVAVIVATFGDDPVWQTYAADAVAAAHHQTVRPAHVVHHHADTLHEARNAGAASTDASWLVFCDADDLLERDYIAHMAAVVADDPTRPRLVQPSIRHFTAPPGTPRDLLELDDPWLIPPRRPNDPTLWGGNHLVIGTMVHHGTFDEVGGFLDWPAWEDWCLFLRCWLAGAEVCAAPDAHYLIRERPESRNETGPDRQLGMRILDNARRWQHRRR